MNLLLFEDFSENIDLKNEVQDHLSQYPYVAYTIKDDDKGVIITFSDGQGLKYNLGLLDSFDKTIIEKIPLKVKITRKKDEAPNQSYKGKEILQNIETVDFPELGLKGVEAKLDSGANTSSLHCKKIKFDRSTKKVTFIPLDESYDSYKGNSITKTAHSEIRVQSSNGSETSRVLIKTDIVIRGKTYETFISLANREKLDYAVLLGKDLLVNFLIQPGL